MLNVVLVSMGVIGICLPRLRKYALTHSSASNVKINQLFQGSYVVFLIALIASLVNMVGNLL